MKAFIPERVMYPVSEDPNAILIVGKNEAGITTNFTLNDSTLAARLQSTPEMIINPARAPLVATVVQQAVAKMMEDGVLAPGESGS